MEESTKQKESPIDMCGNTSLHLASIKGDVRTIKDALKYASEVSINSRNNRNETPLHLAAANGHSHIVKFLLKSGSQPNIRNSKGQTALCAAVNKDYKEVINILIRTSFDTDVNLSDYAGRTALHEASYMSAKLLLENAREIKIDCFDSDGNTPLHLAISRSRFCSPPRAKSSTKSDLVRLLLKHGADRNKRNWKGKTPLMEAALDGDIEIVSLLLTKYKLKADPDVKDNKGRTALFYAVKKADVKVIEMLLNAGADINCYDLRGFTALHEAVFFPSDVYIDGILRSKFYSNRFNRSELERCNLVAPVLLENKSCNREIRDFRNRTPKDLIQQFITTVRRLHNFLDKPICSKSISFPYFSPSFTNDDETLSKMELLHSLDNRNGQTILHRLCSRNFVEVLLIDLRKTLSNSDFKTFIDCKDAQGRTALHYAYMNFDIKRRFINTARLIAEGADQEIKDKFGRKPEDCSFSFTCKTTTKHRDEENHLPVVTSKHDQYPISGFKILQTLYTKPQFWKILTYDKGTNFLKLLEPESYAENSPNEIWTMRGFAYRNSTTVSLLQDVHTFVEKVLKLVAEMEPRFESRCILVGSAKENTKIMEADEFDFDAILVKFGNLCQIEQLPDDPKGFVKLKKFCGENEDNGSKDFAALFDKDGVLLTNEINWRFQTCVQAVLEDRLFWQDEERFTLDLDDEKAHLSLPTRICATLILQVNVPDEGEHVVKRISVDIVPCIHLNNWWPGSAICHDNSEVTTSGCNLVFDQPQRKYPWIPYSAPYARISFAPAESQLVADSPAAARAALMVAKHIVKKPKHSYVLKACLLYCLEAFNNGQENNMDFEEVTEPELNFWVRKILKCYLLFCLQDFVPCYFLPDFHLPFKLYAKSNHELLRILGVNGSNGLEILSDIITKPDGYCSEICNVIYEITDAYRLYWSVCGDETEVKFCLPDPEISASAFNRGNFIAILRGDASLPP